MKAKFFIGLGLLVFLKGCGVDWFSWFIFRRNPNLKSVISEENCHLIMPCWHPDGKIFYLEIAGSDAGTLMVVNADGSGKKKVIDGAWSYLTMSRDGTNLAVIKGKLSVEYWGVYIDSGGILILLTPDGEILDTVPTSQPYVLTCRFGWSDTFLYYYAYGSENDSSWGFYRINLYTWEEKFIEQCRDLNIMGFEVTPDGEIVEGMQSFNPVDHQYIISPQYLFGSVEKGEGLILLNFLSGEMDTLDTAPYPCAVILYPSWSPLGKDVVFSSAKCVGDPVRPTWFEIWILKDVLESEGDKK